MALDIKTAGRLIKFLELIGSDHDGEAINAARMATKLLKQHNLKWADIIFVQMPAQPAPPPSSPRSPPYQPPQSPFGSHNPYYHNFNQWQNAQQAHQYQQAYNRPHQTPDDYMREWATRQQQEAMHNAYDQQARQTPGVDPEISKRDEEKRGWFKHK